MVATLARNEFLEDIWDYRPGESIGLFGNTGSGKTWFAYQLAQQSLRQNPGMRFTSFQPKPSDETTDGYVDSLGLKVSDSYPFRKRFWENDPYGWVHWPRHITTDTDADIEHITKAFKKSLSGEYWHGNVLSFVDDEFLLASKYGCANELEQYLIAGRSNRAGLMFALQAPKGTMRTGVSSFHFSQPTHMLWNRENVQANRDKYAEVACGIDPVLIESLVGNLRTYRVKDGLISESLYIDRRGPYACIVSPF